MKKILLLLFSVIFFSGLFGQNNTDRAKTCYNEGRQALAQQQPEKAIKCLEESASIFKQLGQNKNYVIVSLALNSAYNYTGNTEKALEILETILPVAKESFGTDNKVTAEIYSRFGETYYYLGKTGVSLRYYDTSVTITEKIYGENSPETAKRLSNLANIMSEQGNLKAALKYSEKSYTILQKVYGENSVELINSLNTISNIYTNLGQYDKAEEYANKILKIATEKLGKDNEIVVKTYMLLANIALAKEEYDHAKEYLELAQDIASRINSSNGTLLADVYVNLGITYKAMENYDLALQYYTEALKIYRKYYPPTHPDVIGTINNIAILHRNAGNYEQALNFYQQALDILLQSDPNNKMVPILMSNIGSLYFNLHKYDSSKVIYSKAIKILIAKYGIHSPTLAIPFLNMGNIYIEEGNYDKALEYFQNALIANSAHFNSKDYNDNPDINDYYTSLTMLETALYKGIALTEIYKQKNDKQALKAAFNTFVYADNLVSELRKTITTEKDKLNISKFSVLIYENAITTSLYLAGEEKTKSEFYKNKAFYFAERNKAALLAQSLNDVKAQKFAGIPQEVLQQERFLKTQISNLEEQLANIDDISKEYTIRNQLFELKQNYRKLISEMEQDYPEYYKMKYSKNTVTIEQIQSVLEEHQAMISYFVGYTSLYTFIITRDTMVVTRSESKDLTPKVLKLRTVIKSNETQDIIEFQKISYDIYRQVMPNLSESITKLTIIPDGILNILPFEALLINNDLPSNPRNFSDYPFLIKTAEISYSYSAYLYYSLHYENLRSLGNTDLLAVAPVFEGDNRPRFNGVLVDPLPGTKKEVEKITQLFYDEGMTYKIMLGPNATETDFKSANLEDYKIIHLATHGFINSEHPNLSALIFSKEDDGINDGFLYAGEIYNLKLNASLVTLSACETGLGKLSRGEGVIGLSRAFFYAGARNMIISLWAVADVPTQMLMENFYKHLLSEIDYISIDTKYSSALRQAKLDMIKNNKTGHPYLWSSFILIGQ